MYVKRKIYLNELKWDYIIDNVTIVVDLKMV